MKTKERKKVQLNFAEQNIEIFFNLLDKRFKPKFDKHYIREIKKISQSFNIRLKREEKLKFCRKCETYWNSETREIRFNSKTHTKEYVCKNCGFIRRFKYK